MIYVLSAAFLVEMGLSGVCLGKCKRFFYTHYYINEKLSGEKGGGGWGVGGANEGGWFLPRTVAREGVLRHDAFLSHVVHYQVPILTLVLPQEPIQIPHRYIRTAVESQ